MLSTSKKSVRITNVSMCKINRFSRRLARLSILGTPGIPRACLLFKHVGLGGLCSAIIFLSFSPILQGICAQHANIKVSRSNSFCALSSMKSNKTTSCLRHTAYANEKTVGIRHNGSGGRHGSHGSDQVAGRCHVCIDR